MMVVLFLALSHSAGLKACFHAFLPNDPAVRLKIVDASGILGATTTAFAIIMRLLRTLIAFAESAASAGALASAPVIQ
jgi:hypothetical protein